METVYELISTAHQLPVLVAPLGEYFHSRWVRANEHHAPSVLQTIGKDAKNAVSARAFGHSVPQHTGFAVDAFKHYGMPPVELPDFVPGVHIALDKEAKRVRIFDPLEHLPNRKEIEAAFVAAYHKYRVPMSERVLDRLSDGDLSVWQAWLDKAVSQGIACQVSGEENPTAETEQPAEPQPESVEEPAAESVTEPVSPPQESATEPEQPPVAPQPVKPVKPTRRR